MKRKEHQERNGKCKSAEKILPCVIRHKNGPAIRPFRACDGGGNKGCYE